MFDRVWPGSPLLQPGPGLAALIGPGEPPGGTTCIQAFLTLAEEKALSRARDEADLAAGRVTPAELERRNLLFDPVRTILHWGRAARLR